MKRLALLAAALAAPALAQDTLWLNVPDYPGSLEETPWAWSAIRSESGEVSHRVAADDFWIEQPGGVVITAIEFWTVEILDNPLLGIDWYVFEAQSEDGPPGWLIDWGVQVPTTHAPAGFENQNFGTVFLERVELEWPLELWPGHFFLAFRVVQALPEGEKGIASLTNIWENGTSRGWWSFDLLADGTLAGPWHKMEVFNPNPHEWAFRLEGYEIEPPCSDTYADCDCNGVVNLFDFFCFIEKFDAQAAYADCDNNGVLNLFDFLCFVNAFGGS